MRVIIRASISVEVGIFPSEHSEILTINPNSAQSTTRHFIVSISEKVSQILTTLSKLVILVVATSETLYKK